MPLNQSLTFAQVPAADREAFRTNKEPRKIELSKDCELYKFSQWPLINPKNGQITPWWFLVEPRDAADPGYEGLQRQAAVLGCTVTSVVRARAAVPKQGNELSGLLRARLKLPVYAFYGQCSYQPLEQYADLDKGEKKTDARVAYIGGAWQVYIQGLTKLHIEQT